MVMDNRGSSPQAALSGEYAEKVARCKTSLVFRYELQEDVH